MNGKEEFLGHDLDGARVTYWSETNVFTGEKQHFIEAGHFQLRLDHLEPGLLKMLERCLVKGRVTA